MQRRPRPASARLRRNQLLPVPAPPRTAITRRCWRGRRLKGLTLGFVVLISLILLKSRLRPEMLGGGPLSLAPDRRRTLPGTSGVAPRFAVHCITDETAVQH